VLLVSRIMTATLGPVMLKYFDNLHQSRVCFWRSAVMFIIFSLATMFLLCLNRKDAVRLVSTPQFWVCSVLYGLGGAVGLVLWAESLNYTSLFLSYVFAYSHPVVMVGIEMVSTRKIYKLKLLGSLLVVGGCGIAYTSSNNSVKTYMENLPNPALGNSLALASALCNVVMIYSNAKIQRTSKVFQHDLGVPLLSTQRSMPLDAGRKDNGCSRAFQNSTLVAFLPMNAVGAFVSSLGIALYALLGDKIPLASLAPESEQDLLLAVFVGIGNGVVGFALPMFLLRWISPIALAVTSPLEGWLACCIAIVMGVSVQVFTGWIVVSGVTVLLGIYLGTEWTCCERPRRRSTVTLIDVRERADSLMVSDPGATPGTGSTNS